jgi:fibronectin type 3 domain-containing protein
MASTLYHGRIVLLVVGVLLFGACSGGGDSAPAVQSNNTATTASLTLGWDPNQENDLAGYRIYQATAPGRYGPPIATVPRTSTSHVVTNLQKGTTYYFVVAAFDSAGNEGPLSNEIPAVIP